MKKTENHSLEMAIIRLSQLTGIAIEAIKGQNRIRQNVMARCVFASAARKKGYSYNDIGSILNRNHATIMFNINQYNNLSFANGEIDANGQTIRFKAYYEPIEADISKIIIPRTSDIPHEYVFLSGCDNLNIEGYRYIKSLPEEDTREHIRKLLICDKIYYGKEYNSLDKIIAEAIGLKVLEPELLAY